jgi:hypothetical protein
MSLDLATALKTFLASAPQTVHPIFTLSISHSAMSQTFHLWREPYPGVAGGNSMQPCNIDIKLAGSPGHLDQKFDIRLSTVDIDDVLREQLDRIPVATLEKIQIIYREFLSNDLATVQASATLQAESISYQIGTANISAVAARYNTTRTGELYAPKTIPMLRGFL